MTPPAALESLSARRSPAIRARRAGAEPFDPAHFRLPPELEASAPPEARGFQRDAVRLLVARRADMSLAHLHFTDLPRLLDAGDVLVVNVSATLPASVEGEACGGVPAILHFSGRLPGGLWMVELRHRSPAGAGPTANGPWLDAEAGQVIRLPGGGRVELRVPAARSGCGSRPSSSPNRSSHTWLATDGPSVTRTSRKPGPSPATKPSSPRCRAAPRCRARPVHLAPR